MDIALLTAAIIIIICIMANNISSKIGVPSLLLFLVLGMIFNKMYNFNDYVISSNICTVTLIFIMFYGGFGTNWQVAKPVAVKSFLLSFIGTFLTSMITGLLCYLILKIDLFESFLIGSVIGSTDAASVFSILRSKNLNLKDGLASLLELESGSNDPMSYMLTVIFLGLIGKTIGSPLSIILMLFKQIVFALIVAALVSYLSYFILKKIKFAINGLDTIFVFATALLSYSLSAAFGGNGFLSAYIVGIVLGNCSIKNKVILVNFFDGITGLMQMILFFLLMRFIWNSYSKSDAARSPFTLTAPSCCFAYSARSPEDDSTETFGYFSVALRAISTRSSTENIGEVLVELYIMHTMTLSNIFELRRMIFRCPSVIGSKLPGQIAMLIRRSPWCRCRP